MNTFPLETHFFLINYKNVKKTFFSCLQVLLIFLKVLSSFWRLKACSPSE